MTLKLYNSLSKQKETFEPLNKEQVTFYVCGVTVYDYCHIGHARAYVTFDTIRRYLNYLGYKTKYIQNFTDIDDKIINKAQDLNINIFELTEKFIAAYQQDMQSLNIQKADNYPRATEYVAKMQDMIQTLLDKDIAYKSGSDVFFSVEKFKNYGKLSGKVLADLQAGNRVDINEQKKSPFDFVLWKAAKPNEPSWPSPWGEGRPGWHLECSVMALSELGETIDIHGGGEDLVFPHHENEIAQSESCTGKQFVKYWLHNGFVNINDEKMSKSKKNFFTIKEILKNYSGEVIRFFLLKSHYRTPLNFSFDGLDEAKTALTKLHKTLNNSQIKLEATDKNIEQQLQQLHQKFLQALDDDFNFAAGIGVLFEMNKVITQHQCGLKYLKEAGQLLGLFFNTEKKECTNCQKKEIPQDIHDLVAERTKAKKDKDFATADRIRDVLKDLGYTIEDTPQGPRVKND